jgi:diguanylate cyclase (GGDEF)-like protein
MGSRRDGTELAKPVHMVAASADTRVDPEPARILVVDDEAPSREGLARLLRQAGYEVSCAADGRQALAAARSQRFDAVLSDVTMPGLDGYALTAALRQDAETRDVPILLISADATSARQVQGLDRGADDFVEKPIDVDALLARLRARLRVAREQAALRQQSHHDPLTGVFNRRGIEAELRRELLRMRRTRSPVSVLLLDVDDFKRINDTFGHAAGDEALRCVADALTRVVRVTDRVARIGGDEFLVVLPDTPSARAEALLARVKRHFDVSPPRPENAATLVRVSAGAATAATGEVDIDALIGRADAAMYADKRRRTGFPTRG